MSNPVPPRGHNGGPPLDGSAGTPGGRCKLCRHWRAPPESQQRAYEFSRLGLSRRQVKRPSGTCDRVLLGNRTTTVFSATNAEFGCRNFEARPEPPRALGSGYVTIWRSGRIAWQGSAEEIPPRFLEDDHDP